jgi:hypothetical protein
LGIFVFGEQNEKATRRRNNAADREDLRQGV